MNAEVRFSLQQVRVASPCQERWEDMKGDDVTRLCAGCGMNVHNLSAMTNEEAQVFITQAAKSQRRTCIRMYKRADGTLLTSDCPVGLAAVRRRVWAGVRRVAAAIALAGVSVLVWKRADAAQSWRGATQTRGVRPYSWISERLGVPAPSAGTSVIMGDMCLPTPPTLPQHVKDLVGIPAERSGS